jgi:hypothetical protein
MVRGRDIRQSKNEPAAPLRGIGRVPLRVRAEGMMGLYRGAPMLWFILVRVLFVLAVTYAARLTRPFSADPSANLVVGAVLGAIIIWIETRLRSAEVTDLLGALIGGAIGLGLAKTIGAALFWADAGDRRVVFLHSFILLVFPYLGIVMGARKGEWLEPARLAALFRNPGCSATPGRKSATGFSTPA